MTRLATLLIAAVLAVGFGSVQFAQSQTEAPPAAQTTPAAQGKKGLTAEEKAKLKEERAAKKAAKATAKAKRQECRAKGKQDNLKGKKLREFVQTCTGE